MTPTPPRFHPQVVAMLRREREAGVRSITNYEPAEFRRLDAERLAASARVVERVGRTEVRRFAGPGGELRATVHWPIVRGRKNAGKRLPILVYYHGGGFVAGSVEDMDGACRRLANESGYIVASIDYRLAPESKFPAAVEDCYAAAAWASAEADSLGADAGRLAVGGSSAGGNLAAVVCQLARDRGGPRIARQLLVYPVTDITRSLRKFSKRGFGPTDHDMRWCYRHYLNSPGESRDPRASPLLGDLRGLPPAVILTAEYDTLTEQVDEYAEGLEKGGVEVRRRMFDGMMHGFFGMVESLDTSGEAVDWAASQLRMTGPGRAPRSGRTR